ncbi:MAG TPA: NAD(P)/FAD-dependent oxidoreductase [Chthoniobacteraceae bacterium]|jgi:predicted Rossmann fold flavoprotein|nr:NAD(P)/FAD-dependent oxidoreductase [Chthoniobacteraceae bacterium]
MSSFAYDVAILGGGGAGLMCAIAAGQRGRRVLVLEGNERVGRKIEISGGGRCNFTNLQASAENYLSENPAFCKSALARYTPWDFVALVEKHGIAYHEKTLGQQFCDGSSRAIIEMLLAECAEAGVEIRTGCRAEEVEKMDAFRVTTSGGVFESKALVVATGGLSFPKLGATDFGFRLAKRFGLRVTPLRPGLVPLTLSVGELKDYGPLSGVSLPVVARDAKGDAEFPESMLFTHRGLSGPAVLQVSSYWREGEEVTFDLLPGVEAADWLEQSRAEKADLATLLARHWPRRLAETWASRNALGVRLAHLRAEDKERLAGMMNRWTIRPAGTEGYAKAEVTLGGVDTAELSSKTMEARRVPGLYFIGEAVDVTGWLGGYNFQWAWASGHAAGSAV